MSPPAPADRPQLFRLRDESLEPPVPAGLPARIASVRPPLDPFAAAAHDLERLRFLVSQELEADAPTLAPFFRQIEDVIARLKGLSEPGAPKGAEEDAAALRDELQKGLYDLEDLLEVFLLIRKRSL